MAGRRGGRRPGAGRPKEWGSTRAQQIQVRIKNLIKRTPAYIKEGYRLDYDKIRALSAKGKAAEEAKLLSYVGQGGRFTEAFFKAFATPRSNVQKYITERGETGNYYNLAELFPPIWGLVIHKLLLKVPEEKVPEVLRDLKSAVDFFEDTVGLIGHMDSSKKSLTVAKARGVVEELVESILKSALQAGSIQVVIDLLRSMGTDVRLREPKRKYQLYYGGDEIFIGGESTIDIYERGISSVSSYYKEYAY